MNLVGEGEDKQGTEDTQFTLSHLGFSMHSIVYFSLSLVLSNLVKMWLGSLSLVAHTCNPTYSGGRDQEN
jgi:hypothetical protein